MTREEALENCCFHICKSEAQVKIVLNEVFDYFEQRIAELEAPKNCEGCKYNRFGCDSLGYATDCTIQFKICARACDDYYEPKEQK